MSDDHRPWYKELHWQILLGLVLALIYALVVRQVVGVPASGEVEAAGQTATSAASSVVHGGVDVAQQRAAAIAELQPWRAPFSFVGDLFIRLLMLIIIPL
ncbi:MAG: hypothetical protein ACOC9J_03815, partial [Persicimonas sp.]